MAGMGANSGGPVQAGAMSMMGGNNPPSDTTQLLNTYIYDYLLKNQHWELARGFNKTFNLNIQNGGTKSSPGQRNVNGVDSSMDEDSKDDETRPSDLPKPLIPGNTASDNSFLFDWWSQFWDVFAAQRAKPTSNTRTAPYLGFSKQQAQIRNDRNGTMMNVANMGGMMRPGMNPQHAEMQKRMLAAGNRPNNPAMQAMQQATQKNMMNGMQRDASMGEQRPSPPSNGENVPSPSKRPRVEGGFNGQVGPGGRSQPMPGQQMGATSGPGGGPMMMANGMQQGEMGPNGFGFNPQNQQQKPMDGMGPNGPQQMGAQGMEGQADLFAGNANAGRMAGGGPNQPGGQAPPGNHALQDYQMQLMLLEQQNKKRLLMARQEQDNLTQVPHAGVGGQPGFGSQAMSPQGSRAGPSPNPADQMKRATPKIGQTGLPGSPMPDGNMQGNRASPIPNGAGPFDPSQMPPGMPPQYYAGQMGANGMRPPSSHPNPNFGNGPMNPAQMEAMRRQQQGQMPNGMWPGAPHNMMPQNPGQQQPQMGTPQQRSMPPPPAPQGSGEQQRTQPPSPQPNANAPPTPSQTNKAAPKGKKEKPEGKKKNPPKKNSVAAGATPASDADPPPTPTPSTPITPMHASSFAKNGQPQGGNNPNQQQTSQPAQQVVQPSMDPNAGAPFGTIDSNDGGMDLNFGSLDGPDVLETFDFDSFLHTEDNSAFAFGDFNTGFTTDGVEAGDMN
ncbi:hypothetical protein EJ05DRAFT_490377 [Pseudovirgaria hyperparasitica]|uniref:LisH domain-containing protein n=1 Tax=Pseudovirgaria hyperparasitica TaxID=470096 RepID=A0A6A6VSN3_9PEZI|nr:uncharacterized protein EJ05DRAFT_490377 [Pseudovirgaria hyperparasitica]KAF2753165.1 hypothetical protein EJ05DRAFT_490377 [Pseudovirgaria hyperparasitica]